jgi:2-oxoglutarate dehydrogenase E2 component (dihydrolipoamide succinyltransferase)
MPALGESVTEGTVTRWLKKEGDQIAVDEPLLEVSTDKVDTEIPSPVAGVLQKIIVQVDSTVAVGAELAVILESEGSNSKPDVVVVEHKTLITTPVVEQKPVVVAPVEVAPVIEPKPVAVAPVVAAPVVAPAPVISTQANTTRSDDAYVTPIVRKLAAEAGVNLSTITGTGVGGRIRKEDILVAAPRAATTPTAAALSATQSNYTSAASASHSASIAVSPLRGTTVSMSRLRKVIADRMVESLKISAQLTTVVEVDVTKLDRLRIAAKASFEAREGVKLTFLPFFAVAVCEALKQHPVLNSSVEGDQITYHGAEHLGVAVDTERGLLVPVVKDAGDLNMGGIARRISEVASRTRENKITPDELGGGTFTITNTGSRGALFDTPIINQPQVAILGLGAVVKRPTVVKDTDGGETIAIRSMVYLALSYDHRVVDGADAARFLVTLKERLEEGRFESDLGL